MYNFYHTQFVSILKDWILSYRKIMVKAQSILISGGHLYNSFYHNLQFTSSEANLLFQLKRIWVWYPIVFIILDCSLETNPFRASFHTNSTLLMTDFSNFRYDFISPNPYTRLQYIFKKHLAKILPDLTGGWISIANYQRRILRSYTNHFYLTCDMEMIFRNKILTQISPLCQNLIFLPSNRKFPLFVNY